MLTFEVKPRHSIGPVHLGMSREDVRSILGEPSYVQNAYENWGIHFPDKDCFFKNAFQVSYNLELSANFIEVSAESNYLVTFDKIPVHDAAPHHIIAALSQHDKYDETEKEYPTNLWFPKLYLNLYRSHSEFDKFETIGICTPEFAVEKR
ncbi:hypothetical protein [Gimesia sp.]|uniref:hypothetical protein n=1 Tax=Gimesia sp. TaxID=2024833 RepID=UPI000C60121A|nr:hypothetical protein [Gimesia sp.]MAX40981.1 hypothetical protein [Gimesia sp.]HAH46851.1 hypothetical protein [Planctomycetaceae bacterium]HBL42739.1 hypothetical protein [Planctomycetaceae bacterium]